MKSPSIPLLQRGKTPTPTTAALAIPPFEKGGLGGICIELPHLNEGLVA